MDFISGWCENGLSSITANVLGKHRVWKHSDFQIIAKINFLHIIDNHKVNHKVTVVADMNSVLLNKNLRVQKPEKFFDRHWHFEFCFENS